MDPILNAGLSRGITLLMAPAVSNIAGERPPHAAAKAPRQMRRGNTLAARLRLAAGGALVAAGAGIAAAGRRLAGAAASGPRAMPRGCG